VIAGVVLAAGAGRRYGGAKQLHPAAGRPMLERVLATVGAVPLAEVVVVLGAHADRVLATVDLHGARPVVYERWEDGQAASLRAGLDALAGTVEAALVVLGDGPGLDRDAVARVAAAQAAAPGAPHAADYGRGRAHPVAIPRTLWATLPERGERPAAAIPVALVDCRGLPDPGDVDYA
jgi:CTP:molybdopterin cytidylyltransferase MocA